MTETRNGASKTTREINDKNRLKKQFISSQIFHQTPHERVQKITVKEQFELRILESFDPVTQELYRISLQRFTHKKLARIAIAKSQPELKSEHSASDNTVEKTDAEPARETLAASTA
jgi:hypothetical protein